MALQNSSSIGNFGIRMIETAEISKLCNHKSCNKETDLGCSGAAEFWLLKFTEWAAHMHLILKSYSITWLFKSGENGMRMFWFVVKSGCILFMVLCTWHLSYLEVCIPSSMFMQLTWCTFMITGSGNLLRQNSKQWTCRLSTSGRVLNSEMVYVACTCRQG